MASVMESSRLGGYVTTYDQCNFSTARQKFSFGVGDRFPSVKKNLTNAMCYELGSTKSKRSAGFGIGQRFSTPMAVRESKYSVSVFLTINFHSIPASRTIPNEV